MRQLKFRAWQEQKGRFLCFDAFTGIAGIYCALPGEIVRECDFRISQFTGLLDKNGKEIFEGDILRHESGGKPFEIKHALQEWNEDGFATGYQLSFTGDQYEVTGNIYENPELLK